MSPYQRACRRLSTELQVSTNRAERCIARLSTDDVLSIYGDGSNMYFHGTDLDTRALGASLLSPAVRVLEERYPAVRDLDLTVPFPLRDWIAGVPQE